MLYACANLLQKKREIQNLSLNGFISEINELNRLGIYIEIYIYIYTEPKYRTPDALCEFYTLVIINHRVFELAFEYKS